MLTLPFRTWTLPLSSFPCILLFWKEFCWWFFRDNDRTAQPNLLLCRIWNKRSVLLVQPCVSFQCFHWKRRSKKQGQLMRTAARFEGLKRMSSPPLECGWRGPKSKIRWRQWRTWTNKHENKNDMKSRDNREEGMFVPGGMLKRWRKSGWDERKWN